MGWSWTASVSEHFPVSGCHSVDDLLYNVGGILSEDRGDGRRVTVLTGELSICFISSPGRHMMVVCVHVCTCVFIYARVCMCTCAHIVYPPVSACVCIHGHKYVVCKCIYARICICVYIYMHMCLYAHVCFCAFLCMCVPVASPDLLLSKSFLELNTV